MRKMTFVFPVIILFVLTITINAFATGRFEIPGRIVVEFVEAPEWNAKTSPAGILETGTPEIDFLLKKYRASSFDAEFGSILQNYRVLQYDPGFNNSEVTSNFKNLPQVRNAEPDIAFPMSGLIYLPDDIHATGQWHHDAIRSYRGWVLSQGSEDIEIAIIDGGVDYNHPDLASVMWINDAEDLNGNGTLDDFDLNLVDDDGNGYVDDVIGWDWVNTPQEDVYYTDDPGPPDNDPMDHSGHGTHCAGDAAAHTDNEIGVGSPGFGCKVAALRAGWISDDGIGLVGTSYASSAIGYAVEMGFDVISMSFGGPGGDPAYFTAAMQEAADAGLVLVAAAGNESVSIPYYPAAEEIVIAVAASEPGGGLADFTNYGDWITITSPGEGIFSTSIEGNYIPMGGTSMATPILAGVAAQLKALRPEWGYLDIRQRLVDTAVPMVDFGAGAGHVDMGAALDLFVSIDSLWTINQSGGSRLRFNEEGILGLKWHKLDLFADDVSLTLSSENPDVTLGEDYLEIGDVQWEDSGEWEVPITITGNENDFEIVEILATFTGNDETGEPFEFIQTLPLSAGYNQVLIITADRPVESRIDYWYKKSLANLGYTCESSRREDLIDLQPLVSNYDAVIYSTGLAEDNIFQPDDITDLAEYVQSGGHLIISGQNIAEYLSQNDPEVLDTLLHVQFTAAHSERLTVRGVEGHEMTDGIYFILAGSGGAWNQESLDVLEAQPGAEPLLVYDLETPEELAGVHISHGDGDIVYCAFGIEGINDSTQTGTNREEWLESWMSLWGFSSIKGPHEEIAVINDFYIGTPWPNPTNASIQVPVHLKRNSVLNTSIFDLLGRKIMEHSTLLAAGKNQIHFQLPEHLSSGTYFIMLDGKNYSSIKRFILLK